MILLNFGWMVDLAMSSFEFLPKFLVIWHPWHPWVCICSDLKPLETDMSDSSYCANKSVAYFQFIIIFLTMFLYVSCLYAMQLFSEDAKMFFIIFIILPTISYILMAVGRLFFLCSPDCSKQPRTSFSFYKFFCPIISARISGLGSPGRLELRSNWPHI